MTPEDIIATAGNLRWQIGDDLHEQVMSTLYADATDIASRSVNDQARNRASIWSAPSTAW